MSNIKGSFALLLVILNTVSWCVLLYPLAVLKFIFPIKAARDLCTRLMVHIGQNWISLNNLEIDLLMKTKFEVKGLEQLKKNYSYVVTANHQSWVDIVILQYLLNRKIPFLRFFLKQELIYVPFLGGAWWALDFPFMKRYTKEFLDKHPEKRGEDLKITREACEKFKGTTISILNFLEGTRFTKEKYELQKSEFKNLLKPKTGGLAFVIDAMGEQFKSLIDVTIVYSGATPSMWTLFTGRLKSVKVNVREIEIPKIFLNRNYMDDSDFRAEFQKWVTEIWTSKDLIIAELKK